MRLILILLLTLIVSPNLFSQIFIDVWSKPKGAIKSYLRTSDSNSTPWNFTSKTPDGRLVIYERWKRRNISVSTSSGKKSLFEPLVYKSSDKNNWSVITLTEKGWIGNYTSSSKSYTMTVEEIVDNTIINKSQYEENCILKKAKTFGEPINKPPIGRVTNSSLYDSTYFVQKTCSLYVEADHKLFQDFNNNSQDLTNWINQTYQCVSFLFYREGVNLELTDLFIWDTPDDAVYPPLGPNPFGMAGTLIDYFKSRPLTTTSFFRQLISSKGNVSGIAEWSSDADGYNVDFPILSRYSTVIVSPNQSPPTNSTNVSDMNQNILAITHELGHNLGSQHTHACRWWKSKTNQPIARIDSCFGSSPPTGNQSSSGCFNNSPIKRDPTVPSIMGYCGYRPFHTVNQQLVNGFKTLPRWAIKATLFYSIQIPFDGIPTVVTNLVSSITSISANLSGQVVSDGGSAITSRGFVWSTSPEPTIGNGNILPVSGTLGTFSTQLSNLIPNTTYHIRAYATNSLGTSYGASRTFFTNSNPLPIVQINPVIFENLPFTQSCISFDTQLACGEITVNVISQGSSKVTNYGIVWSKKPNPALIQGSFENYLVEFVPSTSDGVGTYTINFGNLTPDSTYYIRGFASNSAGLSYSEQYQFIAPSRAPKVITSNSLSVNSTSVLSGGDVTNPGESQVIQRGVIWSTSSNNITIDLSTKTIDGSGVGQYTSNITGLLPGTTYFLKAYAKNNFGVGYGNLVSVVTPQSGNLNCAIEDLQVFQGTTLKGPRWFGQFTINPNCVNYKVEVSKYSSNPTNNPNLMPISTYVINNANPLFVLPTDIINGYIRLLMKPQPSSPNGNWFSLNVKCNGTCNPNTNITKCYFYIPPQ
jgi:hypothetical protein